MGGRSREDRTGTPTHAHHHPGKSPEAIGRPTLGPSWGLGCPTWLKTPGHLQMPLHLPGPAVHVASQCSPWLSLVLSQTPANLGTLPRGSAGIFWLPCSRGIPSTDPTCLPLSVWHSPPLAGVPGRPCLTGSSGVLCTEPPETWPPTSVMGPPSGRSGRAPGELPSPSK